MKARGFFVSGKKPSARFKLFFPRSYFYETRGHAIQDVGEVLGLILGETSNQPLLPPSHFAHIPSVAPLQVETRGLEVNVIVFHGFPLSMKVWVEKFVAESRIEYIDHKKSEVMTSHQIKQFFIFPPCYGLRETEIVEPLPPETVIF
jgi:hypothetical protein